MKVEYQLRTSTGELKMVAAEDVAARLLLKTAHRGDGTDRFTFTEDAAFGVNEFRVLIWVGDTLTRKERQ